MGGGITFNVVTSAQNYLITVNKNQSSITTENNPQESKVFYRDVAKNPNRGLADPFFFLFIRS